MTFKLVSCDGGGIRGYLTCLILQGLHEETQFLDKADGFAGTSTGGLIAVALADGRSQGKDLGALIGDLAVHYRDDADKIFRENERSFLDKALDDVLRKLKLGGGPGITAAQYNSTGLAEIGQSLVAERTLDSLDPSLVLAVNTVCLHRSDKVGWAPFTVTNQGSRARKLAGHAGSQIAGHSDGELGRADLFPATPDYRRWCRLRVFCRWWNIRKQPGHERNQRGNRCQSGQWSGPD